MQKTTKVLLFVIAYTFIVLGGVAIQNITRTHYLERLAVEAPETLLPPVRENFIDDSSYQSALVRYSLEGEWATK